jgi:hypothetical protein
MKEAGKLVTIASLMAMLPPGLPQDAKNSGCAVSSKPHFPHQKETVARWWGAVHAEAVRTTIQLNHDESIGANIYKTSENIAPIDIPIFVMNRADRPDRREASAKLLSAVGFKNVSFPATIMWYEVDEHHLEQSGLLHRNFTQIYAHLASTSPGFLPYIANAISQLETIKEAVAHNLPAFGIFEDDLVQGSSLANTNCRIHKALKDLPSTADMLSLQICYEHCGKMTYSADTPHILKLFAPACTGAIFYTLAGAKKILDLFVPVWDFIDRMFPIVMEEGALEVLYLHTYIHTYVRTYVRT